MAEAREGVLGRAWGDAADDFETALGREDVAGVLDGVGLFLEAVGLVPPPAVDGRAPAAVERAEAEAGDAAAAAAPEAASFVGPGSLTT